MIIMWVARDKDGTLSFFTWKPVRYNNFWGEDDLAPSISDSCSLPNSMFTNLKWEDEPMEVNLLPNVSLENINTNPIYKTIRDVGYYNRDNYLADIIGVFKNSHNCTNYGHPWCHEGCFCNNCEEWHFNIENWIKNH